MSTFYFPTHQPQEPRIKNHEPSIKPNETKAKQANKQQCHHRIAKTDVSSSHVV